MEENPMLKRPFVWLLPLVIFLSGCPFSRVRYEYIPPETSGGLTCTQDCESMRSRCRTDEWLRAEKKQTQLNIAYEECRERRLSRAARAFCRSETVSPDYSECKRNYHECFERCGGKVIQLEK